uniref:GRB2-associated-binding protein 2 isoform X2 n=1 Tax=Myxine glutinosa TaxID=7769 RepID=UPI00358E6B96
MSVRPGGDIVRQGWLRKSPPEKKMRRFAWKRRWFVLRCGRLTGDRDTLAYYKSERISARPLRSIDLALCERVDAGLHGARIRVASGVGGSDIHVFALHTVSRVFYLVETSPEEMSAWVSALCRVCGFVAQPEPAMLNLAPVTSTSNTTTTPTTPTATTITLSNVTPTNTLTRTHAFPNHNGHPEVPPKGPGSIPSSYDFPTTGSVQGERLSGCPGEKESTTGSDHSTEIEPPDRLPEYVFLTECLSPSATESNNSFSSFGSRPASLSDPMPCCIDQLSSAGSAKPESSLKRRTPPEPITIPASPISPSPLIASTPSPIEPPLVNWPSSVSVLACQVSQPRRASGGGLYFYPRSGAVPATTMPPSPNSLHEHRGTRPFTSYMMYDIPPAPGARFRIQRAFSLNSSPETPPPSSVDQALSIQPTPPPRPQRSKPWLHSGTEVTLSYMRPTVHRPRGTPVVPQRILPQGSLSYKTWDGRLDNHLRSHSLAEGGAYSVPPPRSAPLVYSTGAAAGLRRERALSEQGPVTLARRDGQTYDIPRPMQFSCSIDSMTDKTNSEESCASDEEEASEGYVPMNGGGLSRSVSQSSPSDSLASPGFVCSPGLLSSPGTDSAFLLCDGSPPAVLNDDGSYLPMKPGQVQEQLRSDASAEAFCDLSNPPSVPFEPPPINRELKPDRKARTLERAEEATAHQQRLCYSNCVVSPPSASATETLRSSTGHALNVQLEYLHLDLPGFAPVQSQPQGGSVVPVPAVQQQERVDYVLVDSHKTLALQNTKDAWQDSRQAPDPDPGRTYK